MDDALARFRAEFAHEEGGPIYADGNSLGRLPLRTRDRLATLLDEWGTELVRGWHGWIELPERIGDELGAAVLGAAPGQTLVCDSSRSTSTSSPAPCWPRGPSERVIVTDGGNFPTDRYVLEGIGEVRKFEADPVEGPTAADVERACASGDVGIVSLSHVAYRSGALADLAGITAAAHDAGALVIWDLSHSAGAVAIELDAARVDLAVGCTYKYLNAGPGAPGFLYVRRDLIEELRSPIQGWFGQREQFAMGPAYDPAEGIRRFLAGTPSILGLACVQAGVELTAEAGIEAIEAGARALTQHAIELHDERLAPLGFTLGTPRDPARRGAHVAFRHEEAWRICRALIERAGVIPDFRAPDTVRFGFPPLYTSAADVTEIVERTRRLVERGEHLELPPELSRVT